MFPATRASPLLATSLARSQAAWLMASYYKDVITRNYIMSSRFLQGAYIISKIILAF